MTDESEKKTEATVLVAPRSLDTIAREVTHVSAIDLSKAMGFDTVANLRIQLEQASVVRRAMLGAPDFATVIGNVAYVPHSVFETIESRDRVVASILGTAMQFAPASTAYSVAMEQAQRLNSFTRATMGPLAEVRALSAQVAESQVMRLANIKLDAYANRFKIPTAAEIIGLNSALNVKTNLAHLTGVNLELAVAKIDMAWLNTSSPVDSARALVELQSTARAAVTLEPFSEDVVKSLRANLGDWRDYSMATSPDLSDIATRSAFYAELGFRSELTDFPAPVFETSLEVTELVTAPETLTELFGEPIEPSDDEDTSAFARTNRAHMWFLRFETRIRAFIDSHMTKQFGSDWPRRQLPNGLYDKWQLKQQKYEQAGGRARPIIDFADFTDYLDIISRRDNWTIFAPFFRNAANVRESFVRLYFPRIETMHARPLSHEDELLLFVELRRLARAFK